MSIKKVTSMTMSTANGPRQITPDRRAPVSMPGSCAPGWFRLCLARTSPTLLLNKQSDTGYMDA